MKFQTISSIVLLVSLASAGLPLTDAVKLIFDQGYVIGEVNGHGGIDYNHIDNLFAFTLTDEKMDMARGEIGVYDDADVDPMKMSFVAEMFVNNEMPASPMMEDQPWYRESSAKLIDQFDTIWGNVRVRELTGGEQKQMTEFKNSNGKTHLKSVIGGPEGLHVHMPQNSQKFSFWANSNSNPPIFDKKVIIPDYEEKSFTIEDSTSATNNCGRSSYLGEYGCKGFLLISKLFVQPKNGDN